MSASDTHKASEALGLWEPKRSLTLEAARRHSARIRLMRRGLYALTAVLVAVLIWQFSSQGAPDFLEDNPEESVRMINPRYSGRTEDGLPYYLTSAEAIRTLSNDTEVELIKPVLQFFRNAQSEESVVVADTGTYDDVTKVLNLRFSVELKTDDGNFCRTTHARIYTKTKDIDGDKPIECTGPFGEIQGNAYEIRDNFKQLIFKNGMTAELDQEEESGMLVDPVNGEAESGNN